jgi:YYY domain-containing protein
MPFLLWYLLITTLGFITFPLAHRLLAFLPERGYALSRALGLLLWGFVFWLAVSFGLVRNDIGGLFATLLIFAVFAIWWGRGAEGGSSLDWLKKHRGYVLTVEILFLLAFAGLAFVRAYAPEALGTEKPMELAFINAVLRSETFPPNDPWLAGYAISYYYFGYVLTGMMAKLTATSGGVAFNLMIALVFGMSAVGAYGLLYNFLRLARKTRPLLAALAGPLFLLIVSNLEGFFEVLRRRNVGWNGEDGPFWAWLDMKDLSTPPASAPDMAERFGALWAEFGLRGLPIWFNDVFAPDRYWWWWRAARVLHDNDLQGNFVEVIDEFPFFSFLLADLHPHVLAMPFVLLAVGMAFNLYLGGWRGEIDLRLTSIPLSAQGFLALAVVLGGIAFLNTWDLPVTLALAGLGLALRRIREHGLSWARLEELVVTGLALGAAAILLYLPFYVSFSSQAGGILPNIIFPTRGAYLWMMFGSLFAPLFFFLWYLRAHIPLNLRLGFGLVLGLTLFLWLFSVVFGLVLANTDAIRQFITAQGATDVGQVLAAATLRRFEFIGGLLTLVVLLGLGVSYLTATWFERRSAAEAGSSPESRVGGESDEAADTPFPFLLLMIILGGLLVLAPEFVYLRDHFGTRMNTIFKFYYQAWILWSLAAAFGFVTVLGEWRGWRAWVARTTLLAMLVMSLAYPVFGLPNRANYFQSQRPTLDAGAYLANYASGDVAVIEFLRAQPFGVVAEAVGGSYSEYGRIATHTGLQSVMNWGGHQSQWRGSDQAYAGREADMRVLYETRSWDQAREILLRYNVRYVVVGDLERRAYRVEEQKFAYLTELLRVGNTVLYFVPERP